MSIITERRFFYAVVALFALLLFYRLGSWGVLETSEARYAEMSWEMYRSGDLIHPSFMELRHYHKPPLTYVITAGAYWLFGPSPFAARFFLQIALLLQIALIYGIGQLIFDDRQRARLATMTYLSFPILLIASRTLTTDLYLTTFLLLGVWCWLRGEVRGNSLVWTLAAYFAWGLACLTKGAGVVILPAVLLPTYYLLFRPRSWIKLIGRHFLGALVFAAVGLSWYIELIREDPDFLHYFLVEQTINRYASDQWQRAQPWGFYLLTVSATALPWFWLLIARVRKLPWWRWHVFLAVWIVAPLLFYSFAQSKLILYVLPIYSGLALLSVPVLEGLSERIGRRLGLTLSIFFGALLLPLLVVTMGPVGPVHLLWSAIACAVMVGSVLWSNRATALSVEYRVLLPVLVFNLAMLPVSAEFLRDNELLVNSTAPVTDFIKSGKLAGRPVYLLNRRLPSVAFNLHQPVTYLYYGETGRDTTRQGDGNWREYYQDILLYDTREKLRNYWSTKPSLVVGYQSPDSLSLDLLRSFSHREKIGRYTVYY
ncbi:Undecaprenyl phosphate-alpha-4-amino-4-deoxy-L-arabinose arabinosyl transferase [Neolewinella maritima]|uniref:Undecaprenyl phosphate-alpha-4-amino-4-deoxy-L-arabinose arabinosyl transferase n=1 Tax=Neolewinella maritima TaxID=1383882 RepID=A0ABM9B5F3_9BACT|nr:glycosyltransferase family 39 protein [Neolewinella maritima]CAH1002566.1 Undecaprenyl phosphate-alpha-4-amino-4-deoxy-L-arabinose arabinosyl transferase [Neolewinella maritima]